MNTKWNWHTYILEKSQASNKVHLSHIRKLLTMLTYGYILNTKALASLLTTSQTTVLTFLFNR